ncbi:hypothetical protein PPYR_02339, partial [Photinus pyralis]
CAMFLCTDAPAIRFTLHVLMQQKSYLVLWNSLPEIFIHILHIVANDYISYSNAKFMPKKSRI